MEPIELGGKTFCSNCGLTIGNSSPKDPIAQITNPFAAKAPSLSDISEPTQPSISSSAVSTTPIKDEVKEQLGIPNESISENSAQPTSGAIIDSPSDLGAVKIKITEESDVPETSAGAPRGQEHSMGNGSGFYTAPPIDTEGDDNLEPLDKQEQNIQNVGESDTESEEISPLGQNIDIPTESDFDVSSDPINAPLINLDEKIKEVDTLGASGILLDILNENYHVAERKESLHVLEAAEELVDKVHLADEEESVAEHNPDILEDQPQNPVEFPEIVSPLAETEIEAPKDADNSLQKTMSSEISSSSSAVKENDETYLDDLYKLPHELENLPNPHTPEETNDEITRVEHELADIASPQIDESIEDSHYYDPDTIESLDLPAQPIVSGKSFRKQKKIKAKEDNIDGPSLKQEAVKNFFKEKVEKPKKKGLYWARFKTTNKGKKKLQGVEKLKSIKSIRTEKTVKSDNPGKLTNQKKHIKLNKKWLLYPSLIVLIMTLGLISFFTYKNYYLPSEQQNRTTEATKTLDFESKIPNEIPAGYEMAGSNFNENNKELVVRYTFVNDKNKTLTYKQAALDGTPVEAVDRYTKTKDGVSFVAKEQNDINFTEFADGTLVWTSDNFLFTIETQGYDLSYELIYKMALSIG